MPATDSVLAEGPVVITLTFARADLLRCRFAVSPLWETVAAVRCLLDPKRHALHRSWVAAQPRPSDLDLGALPLLLPSRGYVADFLTPPPADTPAAAIGDELDRVRQTSPSVAVAEMTRSAGSRAGDPQLQRLLDDPVAAVEELAGTLERCWSTLLAPDWTRVLDVLSADIAYRGRQLTGGGLPAVVEDLLPEVRLHGDRITVTGPGSLTRSLDGRGLLFLPSVFNWPDVSVYTDGDWQPTLIFRARGAGTLWDAPVAAPDALVRLVGSTRAAVLQHLADPWSTTRLARRVGVSPPTVSEHLAVLVDAGLATAYRQGREKLYRRTAAGDVLVAAQASRQRGR
jgi:DNA-binding transcriptional ArsR family regulator